MGHLSETPIENIVLERYKKFFFRGHYRGHEFIIRSTNPEERMLARDRYALRLSWKLHPSYHGDYPMAMMAAIQDINSRLDGI